LAAFPGMLTLLWLTGNLNRRRISTKISVS
jgi:hypothetical protein